MSEAGSAEHVHSEATDGGFKEKSSGGGFTGRRGKFMKPTFASMRAAVPTLESTKAVTEKLIQKGKEDLLISRLEVRCISSAGVACFYRLCTVSK